MAGQAQTNRVRMVDDAGNAFDVAPQDAGKAESQGWHIETPQEANVREYLSAGKGDSLSESAKSFGEHLASTLTFGGSDMALAETIPGYRETRQARDETHGTAGTLGTGAAVLLPLAGELGALGTAGRVVRAAGAPLAAVSRGAASVGKAVERTVAGDAPGFLRTVAAKGLGGSIAGALEGAAIGAGQAVSESAIEDKPLAAELLMARMGEGATVGGVFGGALGTAGGLFGGAVRGARPLLRHVPGLGEVVARDAESIANTSALNSLGFQRSDINRLVKNYGRAAVDEIGQEAQRVLGLREQGAFGRALRYDMREGAERVTAAREAATDELRATYNALDDSGQRASPVDIVRRVDDEILVPLKRSLSGGDERLAREIEREIRPLRRRLEQAESYKSIGRVPAEVESRLSDVETLLASGNTEAARLGATAFGQELKSVIGRFRELGMGSAVRDAKSVMRTLRETITSDAREFPGKLAELRDRYAALDASVAREVATRGNPGVSYSEVWSLARKQADRVKNFSATHDPSLDVYKAYWGILKDEIAAQAERTGLAPELAATNRRLRNLIALEEVSRRNIGFAGNRKLGLTSTIIAGAGSGVGAITGGGIGAVAGGIAGATLNRLVSSAAADQMITVAANRYSALRTAYETSTRAAREVSRSAREAVPLKQVAASASTRAEGEYERQHQSLIARDNQRRLMLEEFQARTTEAREVAPELTREIGGVGARAHAYLADQLPRPIQTGGLADAALPPSIPESEKQLWISKLNTVKNPTAAIRSLKDGTLSTDQVDALKAVFPSMYKRARDEIVDSVAQGAQEGKMPDYESRAKASVFTGLPIDATYQPAMIAGFQQRHRAKRQSQHQQPNSKRTRQPRGATWANPKRNQSMSGLDRRSI